MEEDGLHRGESKEGADMAVLMTLEVPGGTTDKYDRANEILGVAEEQTPPGLVVHVCAVTDDGILIVDVWDSVTSLDDFAQNRLRAALAEVEMPEATPRVTPVHHLVFGAGEQPKLLVQLDPPGFTTDDYDALTATMPAYAGGGASHPSVMTVVAVELDGHIHVNGLWESEAAYREYLQAQLAPAVGDPRHFVLRFRPVHNCVLARPRAIP
jgi:hypothetical protein